METDCHIFLDRKFTLKLAQAVGIPVGRRWGGQLETTLEATKNVFIFFFFSFSTLGLDTRLTILGPIASLFDFAGGVALQAVSECPQR